MLDQLFRLPTRIVEILALGEPIPRLWCLYFGFGAISFGMLSYPSRGAAIVLIPMFLLSGAANLYGCTISFNRDKTFESARKIVIVGMMLMIMAAWTRGIVLWGLDVHGAGSKFITSVVWLWITVGSCFLLIGVWQRGLR